MRDKWHWPRIESSWGRPSGRGHSHGNPCSTSLPCWKSRTFFRPKFLEMFSRSEWLEIRAPTVKCTRRSRSNGRRCYIWVNIPSCKVFSSWVSKMRDSASSTGHFVRKRMKQRKKPSVNSAYSLAPNTRQSDRLPYSRLDTWRAGLVSLGAILSLYVNVNVPDFFKDRGGYT